MFKFSILICFITLSSLVSLCGQKIYENYTKQDDSLRIGHDQKDFLPFNDKGYTLILPDTTNIISGVIILSLIHILRL